MEDPRKSHLTQGSTNKDMTAPWGDKGDHSTKKMPDAGVPEKTAKADMGKSATGGEKGSLLDKHGDFSLQKNYGK